MPEWLNNKKSPAAAAGGEDRFGALPTGLLQRVLSFLPAHDAVRTCVLCRRWRDLWKSTPGLCLDLEVSRSADHYNKFVNHLLLFRDRSPLGKCEIYLDPSYHYKLDGTRDNSIEPFPYAKMWIRYALMCQVRALQVVCFPVAVGGKLLVNSPLISRHSTSLDLECVGLNGCSMDFSSCPVLEDLKMKYCRISALKMSSQSVKLLCTINCRFPSNVCTRISVPTSRFAAAS